VEKQARGHPGGEPDRQEESTRIHKHHRIDPGGEAGEHKQSRVDGRPACDDHIVIRLCRGSYVCGGYRVGQKQPHGIESGLPMGQISGCIEVVECSVVDQSNKQAGENSGGVPKEGLDPTIRFSLSIDPCFIGLVGGTLGQNH